MTHSRLFLTACAAAFCLAAPAMAAPPDRHGGRGDDAQQQQQQQQPPADDQGERRHPKGQRHAPAPQPKPAAPAAVVAPPAAAAATTAAGAEHGARTHGMGDRNNAMRRGPSHVETAPPPPPQPTVTNERRRRGDVHVAPQPRGRATAGALGGWNRTVQGAERQQLGQQWRQQHQGWDQRSPWRRDRNWWRHDNSFRLFFGPRIGFFFFPDYGYIAAPPEYRNHYWRAGDYLPNWFWRYTVRNYWRYGLPQPPEGCAWIWLNDDIALVDLSDGYILDLVRNVW